MYTNIFEIIIIEHLFISHTNDRGIRDNHDNRCKKDVAISICAAVLVRRSPMLWQIVVQYREWMQPQIISILMNRIAKPFEMCNRKQLGDTAMISSRS